MTEELERKCDPEDIICQMQALSHLKGLQSVLGDERFRSSFPELEGLDDKVAERITEQGTSLKEAMGRCGLVPLIEETEPLTEEAETIVEEE